MTAAINPLYLFFPKDLDEGGELVLTNDLFTFLYLSFIIIFMENNFISEIEKRIENLPRRKRQLAAFIYQKWHEVPFTSIGEIAKKAGVSTATVTRLARELDFEGFQDLKNKIKEEIKEKLSPTERFRLTTKNIKGKKSLLKVAEQEIKNINKLLISIDEELFEKAIKEIEDAKKIFTFGMGISSILSHLIAYLLNQIEKEAHCLYESDVPVEEQITSMRKKDILIIFSFPPYSRYTLDIASLQKKMGIKIIGFSDNKFAPLSKFSDLLFVVPSENILYTNSVSAISALINAIATEIALKNKEVLAERIEKKDKILKKFYY